MKKIISYVAVILTAAITVTSCGLLGSGTSASAPATSSAAVSASANGQSAGAALKSLYAQYKADGNKLNMSNLNNIMNMATLAANLQTLQGQSDKSAFYRDFATGLVAGSGQLVTDKISNSVMNGLTNLVNKVDLSKVQDAAATAQQKGTAAVENATVIANSVTNILNLFKK